MEGGGAGGEQGGGGNKILEKRAHHLPANLITTFFTMRENWVLARYLLFLITFCLCDFPVRAQAQAQAQNCSSEAEACTLESMIISCAQTFCMMSPCPDSGPSNSPANIKNIDSCIDASFAVLLDQQKFDPGLVAASTEILRGGTQSSIAGALAHSSTQTLLKISAGGTSTTFCSCLKCGSTSFFLALFNSLHEENDFEVTDLPPYVQDWGLWTSPVVSRTLNPGNLDIIIYRDPIERYVSSFRHRIACCSEYLPSRRECREQEEKVFFVNMLLKYNGVREQKSCLTFDEFVQQLEVATARGVEGIQNYHWLPQDITCRKTPDTIFLTIDEVASELKRLSSEGYSDGGILSNLEVGHEKKHDSTKRSLTSDFLAVKYPEAMHKLCTRSKREYAWLGQEQNELCLTLNLH